MTTPDPAPEPSSQPAPRPPRPPRKLWKLGLFALGLAANLFSLTLEVRTLMMGGDITAYTIFTTVLCGVFAALLYSELGKPKA